MKSTTLPDELDRIFKELEKWINTGGRDTMAYKEAKTAIQSYVDQAVAKARINELENLKIMLSAFTWGPYNPFEVINDRIAHLNSNKGASDDL